MWVGGKGKSLARPQRVVVKWSYPNGSGVKVCFIKLLLRHRFSWRWIWTVYYFIYFTQMSGTFFQKPEPVVKWSYLNIGSGDNVGFVARFTLCFPPVLPPPLECQPSQHYCLRGPHRPHSDCRLRFSQWGIKEMRYHVNTPVLHAYTNQKDG